MSRRPEGWPTAATRSVVLLGHPARHSLSPVMHNAAFAAVGVDLVYLAWDVAPAALEGALATLRATGARGANVTVPHKQAVVVACDTCTEEATLVGAVNTLVFDEDATLGDNTDARGLLASWEREVAPVLDGPLDGVPAVVLGTGGAARATVVALGRLNAEVTVVGRRDTAARALADVAERAGARRVTPVLVSDGAALGAAVSAARLVVNATPLGMAGEDLPAPFMALRADQVASDLVYEPAVTPFLAAATRAGAVAHGGLGMLLGQAMGSFTAWTGLPAPEAVMATALADARRGGDETSS